MTAASVTTTKKTAPSKPAQRLAALAFLLVPIAACAADLEPEGADPEVDDEAKEEAIETTSDALGRKCYCSGSFACGHSSSTSFMYSKALTAMHAAGVPDSALIQTFGDAPASVGTHCPEPNKSYSAATDIQQSSDPCGRTRRLRAQGFAAWFRTAPEFPGNLHIHAVYPAPGIKSSLQRQVASFLQGRNGLASNLIESHCPITQSEKDAVRRAQGGHAGGCVTGGSYCGGDKLAGNANTLYRCNADGSGTVIRVCARGCSVNAGRDDSCK